MAAPAFFDEATVRKLRDNGFVAFRLRWLLANGKNERVLTCLYAGGR